MKSGYLDASAANLSSPLLAKLTGEQQERLANVLDRYLAALERSEPPTRESILVEHPDLAEILEAHFRGLEELHDMAAGFAPGSLAKEQAATNSSHSTDTTGQIGDFELVREIGRGGMGIVYEGRQISLKRRVAVKLLPLATALDGRQIARFRHEAQAAAQLQHPNIVPVFAIGLERGIHFYAMQFIDGQPLDRAIAELRDRDSRSRSPATGEDLPIEPASVLMSASRKEYWRMVVGLGIQAAEALHAAHEYGVVHRDVKPSNLLLESSGKLWVTDFGLARVQREASLTRTGDLVGTMRYMSPEQAAGRSAQIDHRTDVYSLGATLYELLALRAAYCGQSGPELLRQIEGRDPPRLRQLRPEIPAELETVVLKAMARQRDDRYGTAQHLADDLRRVLAGEPVLAQPPTAIDRLARWGRLHGRVVAAASLAIVLAMIGLAIGMLLGRNVMPIAAENSASQAELAEAQGRLAMVIDESGTSDSAVAAHEEAIKAFTRALAADPKNRKLQRQLALCRNNLGLSLARTGSPDKSRQQLETAIAWQRQLITEAPADEELSADLAASLTNLGLLQRDAGEVPEAQASFRSAIAILTTLDGKDGQNCEHDRTLATAYSHLAAIYLADDPEQAEKLYSLAFDLLLIAAKDRPDDFVIRREIGLVLGNLGAACWRTKKTAQAGDYYRRAIEIQSDLLAERPGRPGCQRDLAISCNNLGLLLTRSGDPAAAEPWFRRSLELHAAIVQHFPNDVAAETSLASVRRNLAIAQQRSPQPAAAGLAEAEKLELEQPN